MSTEVTALGEREIVALAISLEEEDVRIYQDLAEKVRALLTDLAGNEEDHQELLATEVREKKQPSKSK
jgi:rubrerythrin